MRSQSYIESPLWNLLGFCNWLIQCPKIILCFGGLSSFVLRSTVEDAEDCFKKDKYNNWCSNMNNSREYLSPRLFEQDNKHPFSSWMMSKHRYGCPNMSNSRELLVPWAVGMSSQVAWCWTKNKFVWTWWRLQGQIGIDVHT